MNWLKQNWYYVLSFILGGIFIYSDYFIITIAFGGWVIVLGLLAGTLWYWISILFELIRYGKCAHNLVFKRVTICILLVLLIGPICTVKINTALLEFYGNKLVSKIESYKIEIGSYPQSLSDLKPLPLSSVIYRYSTSFEEETIYLSFKSMGMSRKSYNHTSKTWFTPPR